MKGTRDQQKELKHMGAVWRSARSAYEVQTRFGSAGFWLRDDGTIAWYFRDGSASDEVLQTILGPGVTQFTWTALESLPFEEALPMIKAIL